MAYELAGESEELQRIHRVKAHEVRAMVASWAFFSNVLVEEIMSVCSWKHNNAFTSYYLKDLMLIQGEMLRLGPLACLH